MKLIEGIDALLKGRLIASIREPSAYIEVRERNGERKLLYNGITFSRIRDGTLFTLGYWDYFMPLPRVFSSANVLVIGLGGGTVPYQLETLYHDISIDVVEIDPNIVSISKVLLPRSLKARIIIGDGAEFVQRASNAYDLIILDAYVNAMMPSAFLSEQFVQSAYKALRQKGILAVNHIRGPGTAYSEGYLGRLKGYFNVGVVSVYNLGNQLLICMKGLEKGEIYKAASDFGNKKIAEDYTSMEQL
ncbi:MAG: spermidine synthase [Candidatus Micrarchaeia archaeon]